MRIECVRLEHFRNLEWLECSGLAQRMYLHGENGQGKTNVLEAMHMLTAFRSFRTHEARALIEHGAREAQLYFLLKMDGGETSEVVMRLGLDGKRWVEVDGERVGALSDFIGRFPTVVFSDEDMRWVRGSPSVRRKFMDLTLSAIDGGYYESLRLYYKALQERNRVLKMGGDVSLLGPYDGMLAEHGSVVAQKRRGFVELLAQEARAVYADICQRDEVVDMIYESGESLGTAEGYAEVLAEGLERDRLMRSTQRGVHRDDLGLAFEGKDAKAYASEGQQRTFAIALRYSQFNLMKRALGEEPVVLADDVLGQLDPGRSEQFWRVMGEGVQVIATGTVLPAQEMGMRVYSVRAGAVEEMTSV